MTGEPASGAGAKQCHMREFADRIRFEQGPISDTVAAEGGGLRRSQRWTVLHAGRVAYLDVMNWAHSLPLGTYRLMVLGQVQLWEWK